MKNYNQSYRNKFDSPEIEVDLSKKPKIRCAIYTRKSREDGLDQSFNSLDNQRLSAENFIASQISEGWVANSDHYDDGACSGGNTDRPSFQRLLEDIKEGKINCVVVYKVERISRSNSDFIRMIEFFDKYKVNFVSVTESFNTGTASGRLMLGMLMNFAQYERELCSERVRHKIDASKKKGIWMGGMIPLGYDATEGKLTINPEEAKIIKNIFKVFIETESVTETARELNRHGFTTKSWVSRKGKLQSGRNFTKESIRRIIVNPLYTGKIKHKNQIYEGLHEVIITSDIWQKANGIIVKDRESKIIAPLSRLSVAPLLKGIMNCGICGGKMTPTYTSKKGVKYRYYICSANSKGNNDGCSIGRISANETERLVTSQVLNIIKKPEFLVETIGQSEKMPESIIINHFKQIEKVWDELFPVEQTRIINLLIKDIEVRPDGLNIKIFKEGIRSLSNELTN